MHTMCVDSDIYIHHAPFQSTNNVNSLVWHIGVPLVVQVYIGPLCTHLSIPTSPGAREACARCDTCTALYVVYTSTEQIPSTCDVLQCFQKEHDKSALC